MLGCPGLAVAIKLIETNPSTNGNNTRFMADVVSGTPLTINLIRTIRKINTFLVFMVVMLGSGDLSRSPLRING